MSKLSVKQNNQINSLDFSSIRFKTVGFTGKWLDLIGDPTERWNLMIWSKPGYGKSTLMISFAKYLAAAHNRSVLYVAKEEGIGATLRDKFIRMDAMDKNITITTDLPMELSGFDYVFIDSVSSFKMSTDSLEKIIKYNPGVNFMFIFQSTGDGNYRGTKDAEHLVDVSININERSQAYCQKSRFGGKSFVPVFEENFKDGIYKFVTFDKANEFANRPENSGKRIVFGNDRKIWVTSSDKALEFKKTGLDIL